MIGTTLTDIRERIEALASEDGTYYVVCGRTGERPVPAAGLWFDTRTVARAAVHATEQYRSALRRYDPRTPRYDLIVCEAGDSPARPDGSRVLATDADAPTTPEPFGDGEERKPARRRRIEFCHRVAAATFETLSDGACEGVETAIMDTYFERAETVEDPDDLCLCLLESMATEIDDRLSPVRQAEVLSATAAQLGPGDRADEPVTAALRALHRRGLVGEFTCAPAGIDRATGARSVRTTLSEYALSPQDDRLPVLPVAVELYRHRPAMAPAALRVAAADEGWRVTVELGTDGEPDGLASAPIQPRA
ncbi:DUF7551 domain-containing protein [Halosimplex amylolyticum]|uniref:DUF7551 domain-containing protein n=1 Tax=Halosimplex amylolyticum TaxID=3396616 RepID=UPI003F57E998